MKLTKENYELIMFDLLEGNIPRSEEAVLLDQIESDDFFRSEWNLFKSTVLVADTDVVYEHKDELIKEETKIIRFPIWLGVAIAASLVFAFFIFIPKQQIETGVTTVTETEGSNSITQENTIDSTTELSDQRTEKVNEPLPQVVHTATPIEIQAEQDILNTTEPAQDHEQADIGSFDYAIGRITHVSNVELPETVVSTTPEINSEKYLAVSDVTYSKAERITSKTIYTIGKLKNPSMKISPDWNTKQILVEFETTGYHGMASLAPFKKKQ